MACKMTKNGKKIVCYDGINFFETTQGYYLGEIKIGEYRRPKRLHIYVWEKFNGQVPKGFDVHHRDHDKGNNDISNLALLPRRQHHSLHAKNNLDSLMENLEKAQQAAPAWHKSEQGRAWHKEQWRKSIGEALRNKVPKICEVCGAEYVVAKPVAYKSRFCSNACKSAYRRKLGADVESRTCVICGKEFTCNKYSKAKTCSKSCSNISESQVKTGKPRPTRKVP